MRMYSSARLAVEVAGQQVEHVEALAVGVGHGAAASAPGSTVTPRHGHQAIAAEVGVDRRRRRAGRR